MLQQDDLVERLGPAVAGAGVLAALTTDSVDWASAHGLLVAPRDANKGKHARGRTFAVAPSTLLPSATPRKAFEVGFWVVVVVVVVMVLVLVAVASD